MHTLAAADPASRASRIGRPAAALIVTAAVLAVVFLSTAAVPYLTTDPERFGRLWPRRGWVWVHIAGGTVALLVGPAQLWLGLTRRRVAMHRVLGRVYLGGVAIGSLAAFYLAFTTDLGWMFASGISGLAVAWVVTTSFAWLAIRRRLVVHHREWTVRSYVVTLGFVTFRALFELLRAFDVGTLTERLGVPAWFCWALPLLVTEAALQGGKILRHRVAAAPVRPAGD